MTAGKKPGENTGKNGGIFQQQGPRGGLRQNYVTVADNKPLDFARFTRRLSGSNL
jgi:hypothetical protein